eukprot:2783447-Rhodomonas_salina.1
MAEVAKPAWLYIHISASTYNELRSCIRVLSSLLPRWLVSFLVCCLLRAVRMCHVARDMLK